MTDTIADLPSVEEITPEDKADVQAARQAYENLTPEQKAKVAPETVAALEAAEKEIADQEAANSVSDAISKLPETISKGDRAAIEAARKAYDSLTPEQKAKVSLETVKALEKAEAGLKIAETPWGDVTGDGKFNTADVMTMIQVLKGNKKMPEGKFPIYDVTGDGKYNTKDVMLAIQKLKGNKK